MVCVKRVITNSGEYDLKRKCEEFQSSNRSIRYASSMRGTMEYASLSVEGGYYTRIIHIEVHQLYQHFKRCDIGHNFQMSRVEEEGP